MSGLWQDHPTTPLQQSLFSKTTRKRRSQPTQADLLIAMLRDARSQNRALELPAIMQAGIAQHGARFNEIRSRGFEVENELDRDNGAIRSRYVLKFDPEMEAR
jgi:Helix-turn-helix domain